MFTKIGQERAVKQQRNDCEVFVEIILFFSPLYTWTENLKWTK